MHGHKLELDTTWLADFANARCGAAAGTCDAGRASLGMVPSFLMGVSFVWEVNCPERLPSHLVGPSNSCQGRVCHKVMIGVTKLSAGIT